MTTHSDFQSTLDMVRKIRKYPIMTQKFCAECSKGYTHYIAVQTEYEKATIYCFMVDAYGNDTLESIITREVKFLELLNLWTTSLEGDEVLTVYPR